MSSRHARLIAFLGASLACGACVTTVVDPVPTPDMLLLTTAQVQSLDSTGHVIVQANPTNADLKSLVDSTLLVLTAGVEAKRLSVSTDLTTAPLYFVGVHRAVSRTTGSYSTWTLVGFDSPSQLANLVEVSGFAQSAGSTVPTSVSGTIGDGTGVVNSMLLQVAGGGSVTQWRATTGTASLCRPMHPARHVRGSWQRPSSRVRWRRCTCTSTRVRQAGATAQARDAQQWRRTSTCRRCD